MVLFFYQIRTSNGLTSSLLLSYFKHITSQRLECQVWRYMHFLYTNKINKQQLIRYTLYTQTVLVT